MPWFGQELLEQSQARGPLSDQAYRDALKRSKSLTGEQGIDAALKENQLEALIAPTGGPAWVTDPAPTSRSKCWIRWGDPHDRRHEERRSRPISRVLSWAAIPLDPASPQDSSNQPGSDAGRAIAPLFGLAPGGVCRAMRR